MSAWLCQCGTGDLCHGPPEFCPMCGFQLWDAFGVIDSGYLDDPDD